jgi:ArsR family transcriptional regulator
MEKERYFCDCRVVHGDAGERTKSEMLSEDAFTDLSEFFKVFSDSTRIKIIWALDRNELCVCDISALLGMTVSAVSHQLSILRQTRLVRTRRDGKNVYYSLDDGHVRQIIESGYEHINERQTKA